MKGGVKLCFKNQAAANVGNTPGIRLHQYGWRAGKHYTHKMTYER